MILKTISSDYTVTEQDNRALLIINSLASDIYIKLPYALQIDEITIKRKDDSLYNVFLVPTGNDYIESRQDAYYIDGNADQVKVVSDKENNWYCVYSLSDSESPTVHFDNQQDVNNLTLANSGSLNVAVAARYGQLNIHKNLTISTIHIHQMRAGSGGNTTIEFYRRRDDVNTLIATGSVPYTAGDFATRSALFVSSSFKRVKEGDYIFMQPIQRQTGTSADGLTCDIHFSGSR